MIRSGYQKGMVLRSTVRDWLNVAAPEAAGATGTTATDTDSPNQSPVHEENESQCLMLNGQPDQSGWGHSGMISMISLQWQALTRGKHTTTHDLLAWRNVAK